MKYFGLVWAGLWRKRTRTVLTALSLIVAFLLFGVLQGFNVGLNTVSAGQGVARLYTNSRYTVGDGIPVTDLDRIKGIAGVRGVAHWTFFGGYFQDKHNPIAAFATNAAEMFAVYPEVKISPDVVRAMQQQRTAAVVEKGLAAKYGWQIGDTVTIRTSIWTKKDGHTDYPFNIVGTYDSSAATAIPRNGFFINFDYLDEARSFGTHKVHYLIVRIEDSRRATEIAEEIDALFANSPDETQTQTEQAFAQTTLRRATDLGFIVNSVVGATFFALLFLTGNTMTQSVRERIPELAVLKTVGFSDAAVCALVLTEAVVLCISSALVGLAGATIVIRFLGEPFSSIQVPVIVIVMGIGASVLLAIATGLGPALKAKRMTIVNALAGR